MGGWEGGGVGGGGGWGAVGGVKHPFGLKGQCCAFSKCHELIQSTREAQTAVRSSLVPHAVLLTHPRTMKCTLVVSQHQQKAVCKSRPGNLLSSAWCFWIVHECAYHVQAKDGFQLLCLNGRFSKIRSHMACSCTMCVHGHEHPPIHHALYTGCEIDYSTLDLPSPIISRYINSTAVAMFSP